MIIEDIPPKKELTALAADVARLSALLTRERERLPFEYLKDPGLRRAYIAYFVPANTPKVQLPLRDLSLHTRNLFSKERLRLLDLGSGPGTAILGVVDFFAGQPNRPFLDFTAIDPVAENLKTAESIFSTRKYETGIASSLRTINASVEQAVRILKEGHFDLIIISNVLNELFHDHEDRISRRREVLGSIMNGLLHEQGSCIIIEPALRKTSREMLEVVCGMIGHGIGIYSPCPAPGLCATLDNPKDWQHEDIPWEPPDIVREIDRIAGLRKDSLKFSYVVLRKDNLSITDVYGRDAYRVVSEPLISKGKTEYYLCGIEGRRLVVRLDKDRSSSNDAFGKLRRGDFVVFENIRDEGRRLKVERDTRVSARHTFGI